jgi:Transposase IS116/IS110/IS902 family
VQDRTREQQRVAIGPFSAQADRLADSPGVDAVTASELIAEIGVDMTRFPSAAHPVSWAKFCPQTHQSAGKSKAKGRGKGNPWLVGTLGRIVFANWRSETLPGRPLPAPGQTPRQEGHRRHRQSGHHRSRRIPNPQQHNMTRLRRVPSACPLTIIFSGQTDFGARRTACHGPP